MLFGTHRSKGELFGLLSLMLWSATIVQAFRAVLASAAVLIAKPPNLSASVIDKLTEDEAACWDCANRIASSVVVQCWVVMITCGRVFIIGSLWWYGGQFLSHTDNLKDFILNSVALGFVVDVPVLFFNAFAGNRQKAHLIQLSQPHTSVDSYLSYSAPQMLWDHSSTMAAVLGILACFVPANKFLIKFAGNLQDFVQPSLCSALKDVPSKCQGTNISFTQ